MRLRDATAKWCLGRSCRTTGQTRMPCSRDVRNDQSRRAPGKGAAKREACAPREKSRQIRRSASALRDGSRCFRRKEGGREEIAGGKRGKNSRRARWTITCGRRL